MKNNLIIYGDIHGCYNEFISLRKKINPNKNDIEVCVGDIITKGKNSLQILKYIQKYNILSVLGNHEDKLVRYLKHQSNAKENPIILDKDEQTIIDNLSEDDRVFLNNLPLFLKFKDITVVHGGLQNHHDLENLTQKEKSKILRMRYLDNKHNFVMYGKEDEESMFWADLYDGNQGLIVYGHQWFKEIKKSPYAIGIDTGCVYGNKLSAIVFNQGNQSDFKIFEKKCLH